MLENSVGYKGPIPRISYSRYFSMDKVKVTSAADAEKIRQESGSPFSKLFCAKDDKKLCECDKLERRKVTRIELLKYGALGGCTGSKNDIRKKIHLSPPPQRFQSTTDNMSSHKKSSRINSRTEPTPRGILECYRELCSCRDFAVSSERVWLQFDNELVEMKQRGKCESIGERPQSVGSSYRDIDEETQREKFIRG